MAQNSGKVGSWLGIAAAVLALAAFIGLRVHYLTSHGQEVFWLAELFPPVAVFSVLVVTFVDKLVAPRAKGPRPKGPKKR
jgi:hypothetical protein